MSDGGEGALECLGSGIRTLEVGAHDPLGRPMTGCYVLKSKTALIELAVCSGLTLLTALERDPLRASTFGTGELIKAALEHDIDEVLLFLGGSATVDGGSGILRALGARFLDARGQDLPEGGAALEQLHTLDLSGLDSRLERIALRLACDVNNSLLGPDGAAAVFGPQKGAGPLEVAMLERALKHFADVLEHSCGTRVHDLAGGGAAGGVAAGLYGVLGPENCTLERGAALIADAIGLSEALEHADLILTGEGQLDAQSGGGKVVSHLLEQAQKRGIPVVVVAGQVDGLLEGTLPGLHAAYSLVSSEVSLGMALLEPEKYLEQRVLEAVKNFISQR